MGVATGRQDTVWRIPSDVHIKGRISFSLYIQSALPGTLSMWAEWWAAEILALFAGLLGQHGVAANGILFNTLGLFYMTFVAVSSASMMRTGFHIGAGDVAGVRLTIAVCMSLSLFLSGFVAILLQLFGPNLLSCYTS